MLFGIEKTLFRYEDNGGYKDTVHFEKYFSTRYEKWMVFNLAFLFMAAAVGGIYSGKFFSDTDVKYIPGQSPAQCFVLIASGMSAFCVVLHLLAAREKDINLYDIKRHGDERVNIRLQQRFPHFSHAWLVILQAYALSIWLIGLGLTSFVWAVWVHTAEDPMAKYVLPNMGASSVGVVFTCAYLISIVRERRPYALPSWKKHPYRDRSESPTRSESSVEVDRVQPPQEN